MSEAMKTVGRYEILREVGRGGMAMVYLARQTDLDRFVALKELARVPRRATRRSPSASCASRAWPGSLEPPEHRHRHDYFEHDGTPYIAMEYVERGSLRPYVGRMTLAQIGGVLEGLLAGLAHAEQHGIVHRDLKPENLMVTADGRVKIADFGIAKATQQLQTGAFLTATGHDRRHADLHGARAGDGAGRSARGPTSTRSAAWRSSCSRATSPFHDTDAPMAILLRHVNEPIPPAVEVDPASTRSISDWIERLLRQGARRSARSRRSDAWDEFEEIVDRAARPALAPRGAGWATRRARVPGPATPPPVGAAGTPEGIDTARRPARTRPGLPTADAPVTDDSEYETYHTPPPGPPAGWAEEPAPGAAAPEPEPLARRRRCQPRTRASRRPRRVPQPAGPSRSRRRPSRAYHARRRRSPRRSRPRAAAVRAAARAEPPPSRRRAATLARAGAAALLAGSS